MGKAVATEGIQSSTKSVTGMAPHRVLHLFRKGRRELQFLDEKGVGKGEGQGIGVRYYFSVQNLKNSIV